MDLMFFHASPKLHLLNMAYIWLGEDTYCSVHTAYYMIVSGWAGNRLKIFIRLMTGRMCPFLQSVTKDM